MTSKDKPAAQPPRPLHDDLHWLFARLARGLGLAEEPVVRRSGLSLRGYVVLSEIASTPAATSQLMVATKAMIDKSVIVGLLDELEQAGFVKRTPDPSDRRTRLLTITGPGKKALLSAQADVRAVEDRLFTGVTSDQRRTLLEVLRTAARGGLAATFDTKAAV
ncbi:MAG TPA: MarR family transcriptional regulator [Gemmatimonadaceae bacterium]|nr:MarR family transcriptional regulator [Gemmatimonadaceae bacterium]